MNICFVVDNSVSMNQKAYNGLSLIEFAKNYIEKIVQSRQASFKRQQFHAQVYHLFKTSTGQCVSGYEHDEQHFFSQLKLIEGEPYNDTALALREAFISLNRFRFLSKTENLFGYLEPFNCEPTYIILFTDSSDQLGLRAVRQLMREGRLLNRHDSQLFALKICPPSRRERTLNFEGIRKIVEKKPSTKLLSELCEATGGYSRLVTKYEQGFDFLQEIIAKTKPKLSLKFQTIDCNMYPMCFKESGVSITVNSSNSFLKQGQFLAHSSINLNQSRRFSRLPLPCRPPKISPNNEVQAVEYPELLVDFSKMFDFKMNQHMPFQKLSFEDNRVFSEVIQKIRYDKMYFPVYFLPEQSKSIPILTALLKASRQTSSFELFFYLGNFVEFCPIFQLLQNKRPLTRDTEVVLAEYLRKLPALYSPYITNIFLQRGYNKQIYSKPNERTIMISQTIEKAQQQTRRILAEMYKINVKNHSEYTSECCPIYSQRYEEWSKSVSRYREGNGVKRLLKNSIINVLRLKRSVFPEEQDEISKPFLELKPVTKGLSYSFALQVNQNGRYLGNPFKRRKPGEKADSEPSQSAANSVDGKEMLKEAIKELLKESPKEQSSPSCKPAATETVVAIKPPKVHVAALQRQQQMVSGIQQLFSNRKPILVRFKGAHLALQRRERNLHILSKTSY